MTPAPTTPAPTVGGPAPPLHGWLHPAVLAAAGLSIASGFAQFGVFAALGDIAQTYGAAPVSDGSVAAQLGLSATTLGVGLGTIRLAALGGLPLAALADRRGRRRVVLACAGLGCAFTAAAALSPAFWGFVALLALARPLLSATNAVAGVVAAEETSARDRTKAAALITAAYGAGAGLTTVVRAVGGETLGFRGLFALAIVPLLCVPLLGRVLEESPRYVRLVTSPGAALVRLGHVRDDLRGRLALICGLAASAAFVATPVNGFVFAYAENVLGLGAGATSLIALAAGPLGLLGLVVGRWTADHWGRRSTCVAMHVLVGIAGWATYAGGLPIAIAGYLGGLTAGSAYAPAVGALSSEVFPTSERSTAAGWLTAASAVGAVGGLFAFGALADALGSFAAAALVVSLPVVLTAPLYARLPETRGLELEDSAPEAPAAGADARAPAPPP